MHVQKEIKQTLEEKLKHSVYQFRVQICTLNKQKYSLPHPSILTKEFHSCFQSPLVISQVIRMAVKYVYYVSQFRYFNPFCNECIDLLFTECIPYKIISCVKTSQDSAAALHPTSALFLENSSEIHLQRGYGSNCFCDVYGIFGLTMYVLHKEYGNVVCSEIYKSHLIVSENPRV